MKPILFLDIDGVLNSIKYMISRTIIDNNGNITKGWNNRDLDRVAVNYLIDIVKQTKCSIVISSTWRTSGIGYSSPVQKSIRARGGDIICNAIIGRTCDDYSARGIQIQKWIDDNNFTGTFVIVDDDSDMEHLSNRLVKTNNNFGLTREDADKIITMLNT